MRSLFLSSQIGVGPSISSSVVQCSVFRLVCISVPVLAVYFCPSSVRVVSIYLVDPQTEENRLGMLVLNKNVIQVTIYFEETAVICALLLRFRKKRSNIMWHSMHRALYRINNLCNQLYKH